MYLAISRAEYATFVDEKGFLSPKAQLYLDILSRKIMEIKNKTAAATSLSPPVGSFWQKAIIPNANSCVNKHGEIKNSKKKLCLLVSHFLLKMQQYFMPQYIDLLENDTLI